MLGLGDLISATLFGFDTYFPGFTVTATLSGVIYGLFLYTPLDKERSNINFLIRLLLSSLIVLGFIELIIDTLWLKIMFKKAFYVLLSGRVIAKLVTVPVITILSFILYKATRPLAKKYLS